MSKLTNLKEFDKLLFTVLNKTLKLNYVVLVITRILATFFYTAQNGNATNSCVYLIYGALFHFLSVNPTYLT